MAFIFENEGDEPAKTGKSEKKYCVLAWLGIQVGPCLIKSDKSGKPDYKNDPELAELTKKMLDMPARSIEEWTADVEKMVKDAGWTITLNDYKRNKTVKLDEAEGANADQLKALKQKMLFGVAHFKYRKVGKPAKVNKRTGEVTPAVLGEEREAWGTLCEDLIQRPAAAVEAAAAKHRIPNDAVMTYYDIHAANYKTGIEGDWRCFRKENFIGMIDD